MFEDATVSFKRTLQIEQSRKHSAKSLIKITIKNPKNMPDTRNMGYWDYQGTRLELKAGVNIVNENINRPNDKQAVFRMRSVDVEVLIVCKCVCVNMPAYRTVSQEAVHAPLCHPTGACQVLACVCVSMWVCERVKERFISVC